MPLTDTTLREVTECKVLRNCSLVRAIDSIEVIVKSVYDLIFHLKARCFGPQTGIRTCARISMKS